MVVYDSIEDKYTQVGIVTGGSCASVKKSSIFARLEDENIFKFIQEIVFDQRYVQITIINNKIFSKQKRQLQNTFLLQLSR